MNSMFNFLRLFVGDDSELKKLRKAAGIELELLKEIQRYYILEVRELNIAWEEIKRKGTAKQRLDLIRTLINKTLRAIEADIKEDRTAREFVIHLLKISPPDSREHRILAEAYKAQNKIEELFKLLKRNLQRQLTEIDETEADEFFTGLKIKRELLAKELSAEQHYISQIMQSSRLFATTVKYLFKSRKYKIDYSGFDISMPMRIHLMNRLPFIRTVDSCEGHIRTEMSDKKYGLVVKSDRGYVFITPAHIMFKLDEGNEQAQQFIIDLTRLKTRYPFITFKKFQGIWDFRLNCDDLLTHKHLFDKITLRKGIRAAKLGDIPALKKYIELDVKSKHQALKGPVTKRLLQYKEIWKLFDWVLSKYQPR